MGNIVQPMWAECPAITRIFCVAPPVLSILGAILEQSYPGLMMQLFYCAWMTVVHRYWLWTVITAPFWRPFQGGISFLFLLFEVWMGMMYYPKREGELGSLTFLIWTLLVNSMVNVLFLSAMRFLYLTTSQAMYLQSPNNGMWPLIFVCISQRCLSDPQGSTNFWGFVNIPNQWYPLALGGFFCLLNMNINWGIASALAVGYAAPYIRVERLLPTRNRAGSLETRCLGEGRRRCIGGHWVLAADATAGAVDGGYRAYSDTGRSASGTSQSGSAGGLMRFVAFAGSGNRLGDGSDRPRQSPLQEVEMPLAPEPLANPPAAGGEDEGGSGVPVP